MSKVAGILNIVDIRKKILRVQTCTDKKWYYDDSRFCNSRENVELQQLAVMKNLNWGLCSYILFYTKRKYCDGLDKYAWSEQQNIKTSLKIGVWYEIIQIIYDDMKLYRCTIQSNAEMMNFDVNHTTYIRLCLCILR